MLRFLTASRLALNPNLIFEIGSREKFRAIMLSAAAVVVGASVILFDPIPKILSNH